MRQDIDGFESFVKIQIFLRFALGSVKVLGDCHVFVVVVVFLLFCVFVRDCVFYYCYYDNCY